MIISAITTVPWKWTSSDFYSFHNGHIVEISQFFDSFDLVEQVIGREITLSKHLETKR